MFIEINVEPLHDSHVWVFQGIDLAGGNFVEPEIAQCPFHSERRFILLLDRRPDPKKKPTSTRRRLWFVSCGCGATGPFSFSQSEALARWAQVSQKVEGK